MPIRAASSRATGGEYRPSGWLPPLVWVANNENWILCASGTRVVRRSASRLDRICLHRPDPAGTSWLDTGARHWSRELLDKTNLDESQMPLCRRHGRNRTAAGRTCRRMGDCRSAGRGGRCWRQCRLWPAVWVAMLLPRLVSLGHQACLCRNGAYQPKPERVHAFCLARATWHQMGVILSAASAAGLRGNGRSAKRHMKPDTLGDTLSHWAARHSRLHLRRFNRITMRRYAAYFQALSMNDWRIAVLEGVAFTSVTVSLRCNRLAPISSRSPSAVPAPPIIEGTATALNALIALPEEGDFGGAYGAVKFHYNRRRSICRLHANCVRSASGAGSQALLPRL